MVAGHALRVERRRSGNILGDARDIADPRFPALVKKWLAEAGLPAYNLSFWYGLFLPAGTPPRIDGRTIDFSKLEEQAGDLDPVPVFSFLGRVEQHPQQVQERELQALARNGERIDSLLAGLDYLIKKDGTDEPKAVLSLYEDFLCPVCGKFEQTFGPTVTKLIDSGAVAADYNMVAILDRPQNDNYSSRSGAAAYCVADEDTSPGKDVFKRFHAALYAQQPSETGTTFPTNTQLIETARQAGVVGKVPECINSARNVNLVSGLASASKVIQSTTCSSPGPPCLVCRR